MKTIEFIIKTPEGKEETIVTSNESYWEDKLEVEKQGQIIDSRLINTSTV